MKQLGFADIFEVAIGADLCATQEAEDFIKEVPGGAAVYGDLLLPGLVGDGEETFPRAR